MSTQNARRVSLDVSIDGHSATDWLDASLIDLTYTDQAGGKADEIELTLHDRDGSWRNDYMPKKGMPVTVTILCNNWFDDGDAYDVPCGEFKIDEVEFSGPPAKVKIKAVSAALTSGLRDTAKTRGWGKKSFKDLAGEIAKEHQLSLVWQGEDVKLDRVDQRNEADLAFINRLATDRGMMCKVHDGKLAIYSQEGAEGQAAVLTVKPSGQGEDQETLVPQSWSFKEKSSGTAYQQSKASYTDPKTGTTHKAIVQRKDRKQGDGVGTAFDKYKSLSVQQRSESPKDAAALAKGKMQKKNQEEATCNLDFLGDPRVVAGVTLQMEGFGLFSGKYLVKKATHKVAGSGGYTVGVELTRCGLNADVWTVMTTDEALAKPARTAPAPVPGTVAGVVNEAINYVDNWKTGFAYVEDALAYVPLSDMERLLMCLPKICEAESGRAGNYADALGWQMLGEMLEKWFSSGVFDGVHEPYWVLMEWVLGYKRARMSYAAFVDPNYDEVEGGSIFNAAARQSLGKILHKEGFLQNRPVDFDFINSPWELWEDYYHSLRSVSGIAGIEFVDGLTAALGAFTFRVLAKGNTVPLGDGAWQINVLEMAVFVHDKFNFDEEDVEEGKTEGGYLANLLGWWNCEKLTGGTALGGTEIDNATFREWRLSHNRGGDFLVLSLPQKVANFNGESYAFQP